MDPPVGLSWEQLVAHHVEAHGSWLALADELLRRVRLSGREPPSLDAAHKGLRRLAARGHQGGGRYGRWVLRLFAVPGDVEAKLAWLGQYHSRFADLPTSVRRDTLQLWDRPPISESSLVAWVHVGLASVHHRREEREPCDRRLAAARALADSVGATAFMEAELLAARVASDDGDPDAAARLLDAVEGRLDDADPAHVPYRARLHGQRAFLLTRASDDPERFAAARALFEAIPADTGVPFVDYRRTAGLAYTTWQLGDPEEGARLCRVAAEHAGDGGYVRFRVMSLNLLARILGGDEANALRARAARLAASIEDFHLEAVARVSQ